jgi:ABC-2 type transport system permease protein
VSRLGLWIAITIGYGVFWAGIAVAINARPGTAGVNAVTLGTAWLVLVIVSPAVLSGILEAAHPIPPRAEWIDSLRAAEQATRFQQEALSPPQQREAIERLIAENPNMEQDPESYTGMAFNRALALAATVQTARDLAPMAEMFERPRRGQAELLSFLRFASPSVLVQGALYDLAGVGSSRYQEFLNQTQTFQRIVEKWAWDRRLSNVQMTSEQYASIPRFQFVEEAVGKAARLIIIPMSVVWIVALTSLLIAFRVSRRIALF